MILSRDGQAWKVGDYVPFNNVWGKGDMRNGVDFTQSVTFNPANVDGNIKFDWSWPTDRKWGISAYPEVAWGDSPLYNGAEECHTYVSKVADLDSFKVAIDIKVAAKSEYVNIAFDMFLTSKALGDRASITKEVMVWLDSTEKPFCPQVATIGSGNDKASVYASGTYVAVVYDKPHLAGTIDLKAILDQLAAKNIIDEQDYVSGYHLGSEIRGGRGSLAINNLETDFRTSVGSDGNGVHVAGKTVVGKVGADKLIGGAGDDKVFGYAGNDMLNGGAGNDRLFGGTGKDTFVFDTKLGSTNIDTIEDFVLRDDRIWLDDDIFTKVGKVGDLSASAFHVGTKANDAADRIIYDKTTGKLWYDADGNGKGEAVQFAQLDKGLALTAAHFDIIA